MHALRRTATLVLLTLAGSLGLAQTVSVPKQTASGTAKSAPVVKGGATTQGSSAGKSSAPAKGDLVDINTATADQLKALPGIGDAYAKRIIDGRPYTAKNQLTSRGVVPQATYDKVQQMIIAKRPAK